MKEAPRGSEMVRLYQEDPNQRPGLVPPLVEIHNQEDKGQCHQAE